MVKSISGKCPVFTGKSYRITILSDRLVRFEYSQNGEFFDDVTNFAIDRDFERTNIEVSEDSKYIVCTSKYFTFQYTKEAPFYASKLFPDSNLRVKLNGTDKLWYPNHPEARNFKSNGFNLNSSLDKGLYSTDGFVCIDDSDGYYLDKNNYMKKRVDGNTDLYLSMYRRDFAGCLKDFFKLSGKPPMIPKYALGIWWNRDRIYSDADVISLVNLFNKYDIPISVFLLSEFWHIKDDLDINMHKSGYTFSDKLFNDVPRFLNILHSKNIKLGLNFDPSEGIRNKEEAYQYFLEKYPVENYGNIELKLFEEPFINLFNEKILKRFKELNVDFLWQDLENNKNQLSVLNYYSKLSDINPRGFTLTRNFGIGAHRYPALYSGETKVAWETLDKLPNYNSGASNHGLSWWSHDIGGFKDGTEDNELYMRYVQFGVFNPIFRFSAKRGAYYKREPWLWDIKTMTIVKDYCLLRYSLIPYIYSEGYKYSKIGVPLVQPLYYNSPFVYDEPLYKNEYFFGSEFLVAAITKPMNELIKRSIERIYLPQGVWYDFKTGKKFIGDMRYVTFFKEEDYPVFVKAGGIVPLAVLGNVKNDLSNPKDMEIHVFPGNSNSYRMYEDDGESLNYQSGDYLITSFEYNYMRNNYNFIIRAAEGKSGIVPDTRNYIVKFRNTRKPDFISVVLNGEKFDNYEIVNDDNNFVLRIYNVDTTKQLTINFKGENIEIDASRIFDEDLNSIINDIEIETNLKEELAEILFSDRDIKRKRILLRKLKKKKLNPKFITMFIKVLEYANEI